MLEFDPHVLDEKAGSAAGGIQQARARKVAREYRKMYEAAEKDPEAFWAEQAEAARLVHASHQGTGVESSAREMVFGRKAQRLAQLPRPASRAERQQARADLGSRRRPHPSVHLRRASRARLPIANALLSVWASSPGDCVAIYMPWCPSFPSPCSPARASARSIP